RRRTHTRDWTTCEEPRKAHAIVRALARRTDYKPTKWRSVAIEAAPPSSARSINAEPSDRETVEPHSHDLSNHEMPQLMDRKQAVDQRKPQCRVRQERVALNTDPDQCTPADAKDEAAQLGSRARCGQGWILFQVEDRRLGHSTRINAGARSCNVDLRQPSVAN